MYVYKNIFVVWNNVFVFSLHDVFIVYMMCLLLYAYIYVYIYISYKW